MYGITLTHAVPELEEMKLHALPCLKVLKNYFHIAFKLKASDFV